MPHHRTTRAAARWGPPLLLLALALVACSGKADEDAAPDDGSTDATDVVDLAVPSSGDPVAGGDLVYGIGADSDGWNPTRNSWAPEGTQVALTVYDTLAAFDAEGVAQPYLAESIEPNDDYTVWTITLRPGVTFHNGEPLTAEAVQVVLEGHMDSPLTGPAVKPIESVETTDELTAVVTMSAPWVAFPATLTAQLGVVPHPSIITGNINDEPIGTGPFQFVEWVPDSRFVAERYPDYWQEGLPYLDTIEYRPLVDAEARRQAFEAGDVDLFLAGSPEDIRSYRAEAEEGDDVQYFADQGENEEGFVQLNLEAPPFDDLRVRQALAYATDAATYNEVIDLGVLRIADGPFVPENPFYVDTDFPTYDPDRARELLAEVEAETGEPVSFVLSNTTSDFDRQQSALLQSMWTDVGFDVEVEFVEQTQYIIDGLAGDYQANAWRQFGNPEPDGDYQWWHSESTLNFANLADPEIDAALDQGRQSDDPAVRAEAYAALQHRFTDILPYIWLSHVEWGIIAKPYVQGIGDATLPDGEPTKPFVTGVQRVPQLWLDDALS